MERDTPFTSPLLTVERGIKTKVQTFRYRSLLSEQNQNILIWSAYYRNKNRTFQSVPKLFKIESERFAVFFSLKTKPEWNQVYLLPDWNVSIHLCFRGIKTELLYFQKIISNETKTFQIVQGYKTKLLLVPKKFGNRPDQKLLDQIFLVLIENVLFRSRILFLKRIYSIFFGTKAAKQMLSILKERWFDIATGEEVEDSTNDASDIGTHRVEITCTALHLLGNNMKMTEEEI
jgi:hypothetical protein